MRRRGVLAVALALALADTSIVTLALPELESDLHTAVIGVAAVLFVYAAVLAVALVPAGRAVRGRDARAWAFGGFSLIVVASLVCAAAGSIGVLLAAGPALGGALTQLFDWRAIFVFQAPVAAAGAWAALRGAPASGLERVPPRGPAAPSAPRAALALVSAALSVVLFLVVLLVVAGWSVSPLSAAVAVTPLPLAAALAIRIRGPARARALAGCSLIGAGVLALAWIPQAHLAWVMPPEIIAGLGMGCALGALSGELLPERTPREAAGLLSIRHAGVAVVLVVLASVIANVSGEVIDFGGIAEPRFAHQRGDAIVPVVLEDATAA